MTLILMFIVCYIYAIFAFFLYNDSDNFPDEAMGGIVDVSTLESAFKTFTRYGSPSGSLNNAMEQDVFTNRWFSEVSFYMVTFTLWNIIKGITIDTFVELRRDLVARIEDTEEKCYMCGIEKMVFNRALDRSAFELHIKKDQNLWNYVYFCIFIWEQDKDDDDGLEYYVRHCVDDDDLTWFPMNKAIRLTEHLERGAADSLPNLFRNDLGWLEESVNSRMSVLKDKLQRSITRVEQALIYQPEVNTRKAKKKAVAPAMDHASLQSSPTAPRTGTAFRPTTGSVSAAFTNLMADEGDLFAPKDDEEELAYALVSREKGLEYWQTQAYMDPRQMHISVNELEGVFTNADMIGKTTVRLICDTGKFDCRSDFDDDSSLASSIHERKDEDTVAKTNIPIAFNKSQWFVIHGGALPKNNKKTLVVQVLHRDKLSVPTEISDSYPSFMEKCIAYATISIDDLVKSSIETGVTSVDLRQISSRGENLPNCTIKINTAASEELISEYEKTH
jgi:hypothetical protein